jgi:transcriptional regulator with XRE-family HTH domain
MLTVIILFMSGEELKNILLKHGYTLTEVAKLLGTPQQNFSQTLNKTFDIKSGLLESLCLKLHVDMSFFYGGTPYLPDYDKEKAKVEEPKTDSRPVPKYMYDELKEEVYGYRDQITELQNQIRLMQQGMTLGDIAQKEAV